MFEKELTKKLIEAFQSDNPDWVFIAANLLQFDGSMLGDIAGGLLLAASTDSSKGLSVTRYCLYITALLEKVTKEAAIAAEKKKVWN